MFSTSPFNTNEISFVHFSLKIAVLRIVGMIIYFKSIENTEKHSMKSIWKSRLIKNSTTIISINKPNLIFSILALLSKSSFRKKYILDNSGWNSPF